GSHPPRPEQDWCHHVAVAHPGHDRRRQRNQTPRAGRHRRDGSGAAALHQRSRIGWLDPAAGGPGRAGQGGCVQAQGRPPERLHGQDRRAHRLRARGHPPVRGAHRQVRGHLPTHRPDAAQRAGGAGDGAPGRPGLRLPGSGRNARPDAAAHPQRGTRALPDAVPIDDGTGRRPDGANPVCRRDLHRLDGTDPGGDRSPHHAGPVAQRHSHGRTHRQRGLGTADPAGRAGRRGGTRRPLPGRADPGAGAPGHHQGLAGRDRRGRRRHARRL
ncbi:MAG: FIG00349659: hypothetical protein, partial [uncultured Ramlibacter sp.]